MAPNLSEKRTPAKLATSLASAQTEAPYYGSRHMTASLQREGFAINRKRVQRLMRQMGTMGVAPGNMPRKLPPGHKVHRNLLRNAVVTRPNLLRNAVVTHPNQARSIDFTTQPLASSTMYDVFSMKAGQAEYIDAYNKRRPHTALGYRTPDEGYSSAPLQGGLYFRLLSRSPAEMQPATSQPNACVNP